MRITTVLTAGALGGLALLAASCQTEDPEPKLMSLVVLAQVGDAPFDCARSYDGIGLGQTTVTPKDLRLYVHDIELIRAGGERVPLALEPDDVWSSDTVALLDYETRAGGCQNGTVETNDHIYGAAPEHDDYTGVAFTIGVPPDQNHLDTATAAAPLNISGMYWEWQAGYRFLRVDIETPEQPQYVFHMGATGCSGTPTDGFSCSHDNYVRVELDGFDPGADAIVLDVAALLADSDLTQLNDINVDPSAGCMSAPGDPQCPPLYAPLGHSFEGEGPSHAPQTVFRVAPGKGDPIVEVG